MSIFNPSTCKGTNNYLKVEGVYLLLIFYYLDEYWVLGDLDVLFEIDDQGKIFSHSSYPEFTKYDGLDYINVFDVIKEMK